MCDYTRRIVNQQGLDAVMPPLVSTRPEREIAAILDGIGVGY